MWGDYGTIALPTSAVPFAVLLARHVAVRRWGWQQEQNDPDGERNDHEGAAAAYTWSATMKWCYFEQPWKGQDKPIIDQARLQTAGGSGTVTDALDDCHLSDIFGVLQHSPVIMQVVGAVVMCAPLQMFGNIHPTELPLLAITVYTEMLSQQLIANFNPQNLGTPVDKQREEHLRDIVGATVLNDYVTYDVKQARDPWEVSRAQVAEDEVLKQLCNSTENCTATAVDE